MRHLPNIICVARIGLVWPILLVLEQERYGLALVLFAVAAASDGFDGFLAKRFGWQSELGRVLDPLADKLLLVAVFVIASWLAIVPWWLAAIAVARDVMIGLGALIYRLWFGPLNGRPTLISKVNTALQILVLVAAIANHAFGVPSQTLVYVLAYAAFASTLLSGVDYLRRFLVRAWSLPATR